ncbi:MAG: GSCFA domain-containing protein [Psychroserpens sp.]|nr:GSCFA domain-containing protein [Psychroserpens sp.]
MKLSTQLDLRRQPHNTIDYHSNLLLLGSCFSEHMAQKLDYFKFQNLSNPFGILFQPFAIEKLITKAINGYEYTENDLFFLNEQWHCFDAHSRRNSTSQQIILKDLNTHLKATHSMLLDATHVIITLGTAWVYRKTSSDEIVANCHKVPQRQFTKELLAIDAISESLEAIIALVRSINPNVSFLFTVSPVRHLKDGFVENTQSKSHLISAIHNVVDIRKGLYYFPSFEIMLDELRDYRFYERDMIHPNAIAVDHIWETFKNVWVSETSQTTMDDVDFIQKGLQHKPFNPNSEAHMHFLEQLESRKTFVKSRVSHIVF